MTSHITDYQREIQRAARRAVLEWPDVIEYEDLVQEAYLHILERPGTQKDLAAMDPDSRRQTIHKIVQRIAAQARDEDDLFRGKFRYSIGEVEELFRQVGRYWRREGESPFAPAEVSAAWNAGDVISTGRGAHSTPTEDIVLDSINQQSVRKDFIAGLERLNPRYLDILVRKFVDEETGLSDADRKRLERALVELTNEMNHSRKRQHAGKFEPGKTLGDGPGSRKAISNSTARFLSKDTWDADYAPAPGFMRDNHIEKEVWEQ